MDDMPLLERIVFPSSSTFVIAMAVMNFAASLLAGFTEGSGINNLQYSKFVETISSSNKTKLIQSRRGMLIAYSPALFATFASFAVLDLTSLRCQLLSLALALHFLKRELEVIFLHNYSGVISLNTAIQISVHYLAMVALSIYGQYLTVGMAERALDLKPVGQALFLLGIFGNLYHHYLLSKVRKEDGREKTYQIPRGGLFQVVICPHYLFEIIEFFGLAFISQTGIMFSWALGSMFHLMGRSYITRKWYFSKFDEFSLEVKALIPYVF